MKIKLKPGSWRKAEILWIDSTNYTRPWWTIEEFIEDAKLRLKKSKTFIKTEGFIVHVDPNYLYIASDISFQDGEAEAFNRVIRIPRGCIFKVKYNGTSSAKA